MKRSNYSFVIVGSGIAGLYAAIKLSKEIKPKNKILLITKSTLTESNSRYAQGGMVCVLPENKLDSTTMHIEDTIKAGAGLTNYDVAKFISQNSAKVLEQLLSYGVNFDRDENNKLIFTKEAAHSVNRILHAGGDATGFCIENALSKTIKEQDGIDIYESSIAVDLLTNEKGECKGLIVFNTQTKEYEAVNSSAVILATGGSGQLYKYTTNPDITTGDGVALAFRAGAQIQDMEFIQFHPTAFSIGEKGTMFLISEAVRGEGAILVDDDGSRFMGKYDERLELAPRDIVTRAIYREMKEKELNNVWLDATHISEEKFSKRFPTIYQTCKEYGINPAKDFIPVSPAAHYTMGGVKTDIQARTSVKGLYAIGEVACTGLHGANRLASNSILECVVMAYELVNYLKTVSDDEINENDEKINSLIKEYDKEIPASDFDCEKAIDNLKEIMWQNVGIVRNEAGLNSAEEKIEKLTKDFKYTSKCPDLMNYTIRNLSTVANLIIYMAKERKESRGAHFRDDYPEKCENAKSNLVDINTLRKALR